MVKPASRLQDGNASDDEPDRISDRSESPLKGKPFLFLGSSVTYGSASGGISFPDFLASETGCLSEKEAVSGTLLCGKDPTSYLSRLQTHGPEPRFDALVVQLSTNDAWQEKPLGEIAPGFSPEAFDPLTVAGAIETILAWAKATWGCPVVFFTSPRFENVPYSRMVILLREIRDKWGFTLLDLYDDPRMNSLSPEETKLFWEDPVHPTKEGYRLLWTPRFASCLENLFSRGGR